MFLPHYAIGVRGNKEQLVHVTGIIALELIADPGPTLYAADYGLLSSHTAVLESNELRELTAAEHRLVAARRWAELPQQFHQPEPI